jgi:hypothetical protein
MKSRFNLRASEMPCRSRAFDPRTRNPAQSRLRASVETPEGLWNGENLHHVRDVIEHSRGGVLDRIARSGTRPAHVVGDY